jgi:hypothetical protein
MKPEMKKMTSGSIKMKNAAKKAHKTEKNALLFTKYKLGQNGWKYHDFQSKKGYARDGITDLIAFKLDRKDHDKLKIILFQVKGGSSRLDEKEIVRLGKACKNVEVASNTAEKPEKSVKFGWEPTDEEFEKHKV